MSKSSNAKHYFLTRKKDFVEVELVKSADKYRRIKFKEGTRKGKEVNIHPEGSAWGKLYPRLFEASSKPTDFYIYKGRVLPKLKVAKETEDLIPDYDPNYLFQPITSLVIDNINSDEPTLITGPTGVGKTTLIEQLAYHGNRPTLRVNFNGETRLSDFIGKMHVINGETKWVDGILPMAMRYGYWLILDELDFADPSVLSLLHPVLEPGSKLVLKENNGEIIKKHPNCRIFATANSIGSMQDRAGSYSGTNQMNDAFVDRWDVVEATNMSAREELKVVKSKVPAVKHRWAVKMVEFANKIREKRFSDYQMSGDNFSTRRVLSWAKKTALHRSPLEGARLSWIAKLPASEHDAIHRILALHFGSMNRRKKDNTGIDVVAEDAAGFGKTKKRKTA